VLDLNPNSEVWTRPRPRRRSSSSMRRRFLQRKEPDVPQLFCSVILIIRISDNEHEEESPISEFRLNSPGHQHQVTP
jgi:hypothetical protein